MDIKEFRRCEGKGLDLSKIDPGYSANFKSKEEARDKLEENIKKMIKLQEKLYAADSYAILAIFQAMDTAGKDGAIRHVMSGLNPQGTQVYSFKQPSSEELNHDYFWRVNKCLPERGRIGIFNRSYYEEVLVVQVHDLIKNEKVPSKLVSKNIWKERYSQICNYERYLSENGIIPIKFFLHISKEEQKNRLLSRIDDPSKNWKFSDADLAERSYWDKYMETYNETIKETCTSYAPWYIIPADKKWFARLVISEIIVKAMEGLQLSFPEVSGEQLKKLDLCRKMLTNEQD